MTSNTTLTARMLKDYAKSQTVGNGGDFEILGIAPIERFAGAPEQMHPKNIFPDCRSVISIIQPIPRSCYRGITEGTYWPNYSFYAYNRLNTLFRPMLTYNVARFIEDHGYEAVPIYPAVPEAYPEKAEPRAPGRPVPDININVRIAAMLCGLGEIGWSKVFIHPTYGPRVRIGTILTDAVLDYDEIMKPGTLCKMCMRCAQSCPGNAIPHRKENKTVTIQVNGKNYQWGDVHMGRCTATHHGVNPRISPFFKRYFQGVDLDINNSNISQATAYKLTFTLALAKWRSEYPEYPGTDVIPYYRQMLAHVGYFAVCGARGCIRACMDFQEKSRNIRQCDFATPVFPEKYWELPPPSQDDTGGIVEKKKLTDLFQEPDLDAGSWE
ncbi:MAG: hypothetical protein E7047_00215 [Lentisphaerae bacterium]|nr:hypothetical protein [Lentisphaerota bacterium]